MLQATTPPHRYQGRLGRGQGPGPGRVEATSPGRQGPGQRRGQGQSQRPGPGEVKARHTDRRCSPAWCRSYAAMHACQASTGACPRSHVHACTCMHTHAHACTRVHMHAYTCTCMHTHARIPPRPGRSPLWLSAFSQSDWEVVGGNGYLLGRHGPMHPAVAGSHCCHCGRPATLRPLRALRAAGHIAAIAAIAGSATLRPLGAAITAIAGSHRSHCGRPSRPLRAAIAGCLNLGGLIQTMHKLRPGMPRSTARARARALTHARTQTRAQAHTFCRRGSRRGARSAPGTTRRASSRRGVLHPSAPPAIHTLVGCSQSQQSLTVWGNLGKH
eukprot:364587-Chlamydomonas_euryale.AAC.1